METRLSEWDIQFHLEPKELARVSTEAEQLNTTPGEVCRRALNAYFDERDKRQTETRITVAEWTAFKAALADAYAVMFPTLWGVLDLDRQDVLEKARALRAASRPMRSNARPKDEETGTSEPLVTLDRDVSRRLSDGALCAFGTGIAWPEHPDLSLRREQARETRRKLAALLEEVEALAL